MRICLRYEQINRRLSEQENKSKAIRRRRRRRLEFIAIYQYSLRSLHVAGYIIYLYTLYVNLYIHALAPTDNTTRVRSLDVWSKGLSKRKG